MLEQLGIIGWETIEPVILAALLAEEPILLVGPHGVNKTDGVKQISKGILGEQANCVKYDTPIIQTDDLLGYLDPTSLSDGKVDFIKTDFSIWTAESAAFDELNRANPMTAAKLFEVIRTKKVMGKPTNIKVVFAMVNPPEDYDSIYMDPALASRFVVVKVPGTKDLSDENLEKIIELDSTKADYEEFRTKFEILKSLELSKQDKKQITKIVIKIARDIKSIEIQPRELQSIAKLLTAGMLLKSHFEINEHTLANIVMSKIPQIFGITRKKLDLEKIKATLITLLVGFTLNDPLVKASTLKDIIAAPKNDILAWTYAFKNIVERESDLENLKGAMKSLATLGLEEETFNKCSHMILMQILKYSDIPEVPLTWGKLEIINFITELYV